MSKSDTSDLSRINLSDDKDQIISKIKKAKTDALQMPTQIEELNQRPEVKNLLGIYSSLSNSTIDKTIKDYAGKNFSLFKENLAEVIVEKIGPISKEIKILLNDKKYLDEILNEGFKKADKIAKEKMKKIHKIIGF